ncbi:hypothetical protein [Salinibacter ruber]|uniref:hypothetical protein n=1 Tax=Salinibacter ruber TaxID=146919 RepID=UPI0021671233|nr:hypothetical protein [Salinibacter ruber]MCS4097453.1 hypothetical protein [Salinibacter ruber]MCS4154157.1 hypothetical protein [Salinibacter ruber]
MEKLNLPDSTDADYRVSFTRSKSDSFEFEFTELGTRDFSESLVKNDIRDILPRGSEWGCPGWVSHFIVPLSIRDMQWTAVGKELIKSHPERGAFPELTALVYEDADKAYKEIRSVILNDNNDEYENIESTYIRKGFLRFESSTQDDFRKYEISLLHRADDLRRRMGKRILLRTCVLSKYHIDQVQKNFVSKIASTLFGHRSSSSLDHDRYIMGCPEKAYDSLNSTYRKIIDDS